MDRTTVLAQLGRVLESSVFRSAERSRRILRYVVEQTLAGHAAELKEYTIGAEALGRGSAFDPRVDAIARVEVSRLRSRLDQYYAALGKDDEIRFTLPRGTYVPVIERNVVAATAPNPRASPRWPLAVSAAVGVLAGGVWLARPKPKPADTAAYNLTLEVELTRDVRLANTVGPPLAISPDGTTLAFVSEAPSGGSQLHTRRLDGSSSVRLAGTDGARDPFFSPESQWIGFWAGGKLKKVAVAGGSPIVVCDASDLLGGSWGDDGEILATLTPESKLWRVSSSGGLPRVALDLSKDAARLLWPQVLPGSRAAIYTQFSVTSDSGSVEALSFATAKRKTIVRNGAYGRFLPTGHLVYINQGTMYAQSFDPDSLEVRGAPVAVLHDVAYSPTFGFAQFDVSRTGALVYRRAAGDNLVIYRLTRTGSTEALTTDPGRLLFPRVSTDGNTVAFSRLESGEPRVWLLDLHSRALSAITAAADSFSGPVWSPDSRFLIVQGRRKLWAVSVPPTRPARELLVDVIAVPWSFTPDGRRFAFYQLDPATHFDLWTVPVTYDERGPRFGAPETFLKTAAVETYPAFSPDGRWIAYVSLKSNAYEVYVRAYPDNGSEVQVSRGGGRLPFWSKRAPELIYETENHRLMFVPWRVSAGRFVAGVPERWSDQELADTGVMPNFDVAPDGAVIALLPATRPDQSPNHVTFRLNFFNELNRLVPRR